VKPSTGSSSLTSILAPTATSPNQPSSSSISFAGTEALAGNPADPISEAGNVVWYVRPPTGGQFGPATGTVMRLWLAEGRMSSDTLVWREGWRDWQSASIVFPHLQDPIAEIAEIAESSAQPRMLYSASESPLLIRKPYSNVKKIVVISSLVVGVLVLVMLLWIFFH
jgi:hypothetical protein